MDRRELAEQELRKRIQSTVEQQMQTIEQVVNVSIIDKLVDPKAMKFGLTPDLEAERLTVKLFLPSGDAYYIHRHAMSQLATVADKRHSEDGVTRRGFAKYALSLCNGDAWEKYLLVTNLNNLYEKGLFLDRRKNPAKFLHRYVGDTLRGFLSRSYNRKLTTAKLLPTFNEVCLQCSAAPVQAFASDVSVSVKCMLPQVFEPVDGEFVAFGVTFSNSDFGVGTLKVVGSVLRLKSGTVSVMDEGFSRTHLGSIIQESDLEMSEDTAEKELAAVKGAIRDAVEGQLKTETIDRMIKAIQVAHDREMPWYKVKNLLRSVLTKKELEAAESFLKMEVEDLPPVNKDKDGEPVATNWWLANMVGRFADKETDPERRSSLQEVAGGLISQAA